MFRLLKVRLFHYTPSIIQWCKHPLSVTFCQTLFTERANGRKRGRRNERTNARGREKTDDKQRERQMEWGRERHWVRVKYPEWGVYGDLQSILFPQRGKICLSWTGYRGAHLDRLIPNTVYNISLPVLCRTGSPFILRQLTSQPELHYELVNVFMSAGTSPFDIYLFGLIWNTEMEKIITENCWYELVDSLGGIIWHTSRWKSWPTKTKVLNLYKQCLCHLKTALVDQWWSSWSEQFVKFQLFTLKHVQYNKSNKEGGRKGTSIQTIIHMIKL